MQTTKYNNNRRSISTSSSPGWDINILVLFPFAHTCKQLIFTQNINNDNIETRDDTKRPSWDEKVLRIFLQHVITHARAKHSSEKSKNKLISTQHNQSCTVNSLCDKLSSEQTSFERTEYMGFDHVLSKCKWQKGRDCGSDTINNFAIGEKFTISSIAYNFYTIWDFGAPLQNKVKKNKKNIVVN